MLPVGHESLGKVVEMFDFGVLRFKARATLVLENLGHV